MSRFDNVREDKYADKNPQNDPLYDRFGQWGPDHVMEERENCGTRSGNPENHQCGVCVQHQTSPSLREGMTRSIEVKHGACRGADRAQLRHRLVLGALSRPGGHELVDGPNHTLFGCRRDHCGAKSRDPTSFAKRPRSASLASSARRAMSPLPSAGNPPSASRGPKPSHCWSLLFPITNAREDNGTAFKHRNNPDLSRLCVMVWSSGCASRFEVALCDRSRRNSSSRSRIAEKSSAARGRVMSPPSFSSDRISVYRNPSHKGIIGS